jgi:putative inorganic carbon (HCO3(-)) transporter
MVKFSFSWGIVLAAALCSWLFFPLAAGAGFHDNQRIVEVFCALSAAVALIRYFLLGAVPALLADRRMQLLLLLFFAFGLLSSTLAYAPRFAGFEWANCLSLLAIAWLIAGEVKRDRDRLLDRLLLICGIASVVYIAGALVIYLAMLAQHRQPPPATFIFGFDNYRFFNHTQTLTLPLLGLLTLRSRPGRRMQFWRGVTALWWMLLFVSAGRGTLIGLLAGVCVAWLCLRKDAWPWCRIMLLSALLGLSCYLVFYVLIPLAFGLQPYGFLLSVVSRTVENPDSSRWPLWQRAWELLAAHPWLGVGPLHFAHFGRSVQKGAHPHNWLLQIACEWGIPALLCLLAAIALSLRKLLTVRRCLAPSDTKNRLTLAAWLTIAVAILMDGLVSGLIVMPASQLWLALYIGCAWGWTVSFAPARQDLRLSMTVRACGAAGALALIWFLGNGLWPEIRNLPLHEEQNLQKDLYAHPVPCPRIWRAGYF